MAATAQGERLGYSPKVATCTIVTISRNSNITLLQCKSLSPCMQTRDFKPPSGRLCARKATGKTRRSPPTVGDELSKWLDGFVGPDVRGPGAGEHDVAPAGLQGLPHGAVALLVVAEVPTAVHLWFEAESRWRGGGCVTDNSICQANQTTGAKPGITPRASCKTRQSSRPTFI